MNDTPITQGGDSVTELLMLLDATIARARPPAVLILLALRNQVTTWPLLACDAPSLALSCEEVREAIDALMSGDTEAA